MTSGPDRFSDLHAVIVFLLPNIKVFLAGLVCICRGKQVLLRISTPWSEALRSQSTLLTTPTGKESLKLLRVWAGE